MVKAAFSHVRTWIFDLDNTLYPPEVRLFDQIERNMTQFVMDALSVDHQQADELRVQYWRDYGTTLAGLMAEHGVEPVPFLSAVHDISFHPLEPDADLATHISNLDGRRVIYTNGTADYAGKVLNARGLDGLFDAVYGVEHADYRPKPQVAAFEMVFAKDGLDPKQAAMFEDDPRNLAAPYDMGLRTVHVAPDPIDAAHIHHHTDDLTEFLRRLTE